ncbi:MAG TPA: CHAT domain-containing protein [Terriglobia bacterium]|nr:CHAT domain-containing protein [Terriglobia bacterium]
MSSFSDLMSKLGSAQALFEASDFQKSLDLFSELLQTPGVRVKAARCFLDLFSIAASGQGITAGLPTVVEVLRLSFEALEGAKARKEAKRRGKEVRTILRDAYNVVLPESVRLTQVLTAYDITGGLSDAGSTGAEQGAERVPSGGGGRVGPHGPGKGRPPDSGEGRPPAQGRKPPPPDTGSEAVSAGGSPPEQIHRIPHIDLPKGIPRKAGDTFPVTVYADKQSERPGEKSDSIDLEGGKDKYDLCVFLAVPFGMSVVVPEPQPLTITAAVERSTEAKFQVKLEQDGPPKDASVMTAIFTYDGRPCGRVTLQLGKVTGGPELPKNAIRFPLTARPVDLTVEVVAKAINDDRQFRCCVFTPHLADYKDGVSGDWNIKQTAPDIVNGAIQRGRDQGVAPRQRVAALRVAGTELFDAAPDAFKDVFWKLVDGKKTLETILIVSEEMTFPWELMIPNHNNKDEWDYPLGARFRMGRWITHTNEAPRQVLGLSDAYVIAPKYVGERELKSAGKEIQTLEACLSAAHCEQIDPPDIDTIDDRLWAQGKTLLHFICHGETARPGDPDALDTTDQSIILDNDKPLSAKEIRGLDGFKKACRQSHPLVFLNACEVGRPIPALRGTGGFADSFIQLEASGVIAALWSVKDTIASKIAQSFYKRLTETRSLCCAEFFRDLRKRAYDKKTGVDTYAAYCFYGDPWAEVKIGGSATQVPTAADANPPQ